MSKQILPAQQVCPWRLEFTANPEPGGVRFRTWAPLVTNLTLHVVRPVPAIIPMERETDGSFAVFEASVAAGAEYFYQLNGGSLRPDPVSRFQPRGVHEASQVVDPNAFAWSDHNWKGLALSDFIFYELHTGTFTPEGTFDGVIGRLPYLRELGVTAIELMPVATFAGARNWGYDGVSLYAPHAAYGGPDGLKRLVNACHREGLAVVLDVVYNHLGPEGNYLGEYGPYFTDRYHSPWGEALNFDGAQSDGVRRFFIDNARYWLTEYHIDALRLDAIHGIFDFGAYHILHELADEFHQQARALKRKAWLIAESDLNDTRIINRVAQGGYRLDAQWNDDFHHALHALLTESRHGYFSDFGTVGDVCVALTEGYVYNGRQSQYRQRRHGVSSARNPGRQFVVFNQNHDQIANAEGGARLSRLLTLEQQKLASLILFCAPNLPMLFMGEEFGASSPFDYFTSFNDPGLADAVSKGRQREYESFFRNRTFRDPQAVATFEESRLGWSEIARAPHRELLAFNRELINLRTRHRCLSNCRKDLTRVESSEAERWMTVERGDPSGSAAFVFCNLGPAAREIPIPSGAGDAMLALFTGDRKFGGAPTMLPPAVLESAPGRIGLPPFSAAIYLRTR
ncbi:MAG TPA: malto-oligosyltrehalose trehalohydrolase [Candidatus Binataceae bacterium]|nr:malto-oligosyltrehalose trehalohydrolase [Candidatus Binataceae bacterium]